MAEQLKTILSASVIQAISQDIARVHPSFPEARFVQMGLEGLDPLGLTDRARHWARALQATLPEHVPTALGILVASFGPEIGDPDEPGLSVLRYLPHVFFIAEYAADHFEPAMEAQKELTKRFSAEYSIRVFLEKYPQQTLDRLGVWAGDSNVHVRRLVSEGTRPRLPWAKELRTFRADPAPILPLLERLKDDPELYVRRSVANNLNDISKDHPKLAVELARRWAKGASAERRWLIEHGLRTLVKKGDVAALEVLGFGAESRVKVGRGTVDPERPKVGSKFRFSCQVTNEGSRPVELLVDYAVRFADAKGKMERKKVFKGTRWQLQPGETAELERQVSLASMTTRKHYPGTHAIELLVNGTRHPLVTFEVGASEAEG